MPEFKVGLNIDPKLNAARLNVLIRALKQSLGPLGKDIKLIDADALKKELGDVERKVREARKKAKPEVDGLADDLANAAKRGGDAFGNAFKFNQIVDAARNVAQAVDVLSRPFVELDTQVKNIGTLGVENFEQFTGLALDLSKKVPDSAANIAKGVYNAISAGITGTNEEIIKFVESASKVGVAGLSDTNAAVNGLTSVLNAYGKTAKDVDEYSNTFFAGIKLGKTTFNELNQSLAQVIPAASAAGVSFQEVIALISQMTALGVPTAQATTQIRQAIIELQKPGTELSGVFDKLGYDASNIADAIKEKGVIRVLQEVEGQATKMGKTLTQVFSSSEASSAALLVTGKNAQRAVDTFIGVQAETAGGAAQKAYDVAAEGIEVRTKIMLNKVQAAISGVFDTVGSGALAITNAAAQLAPTLVSLSQIKTLIPPTAITKITGLISGNLLPSVAKIAPALFTAGASGTATFVGMGSAATAMWTAITGPVGLVVAAIAAVVGIIGLWLTKTKEGQGVLNRLQTAVETLWNSIKPVLESLGSILASVGALVFEMLVAPFELLWTVVSTVLTVIGDFIASIIGAKDAGEVFALIMDKINFYLTAVKANINGMVQAFKTIKEGVGDVLKKVLTGDVVGAISAARDLGKKAGDAYREGVQESLDDKAVDDMTKAFEKIKDIKVKLDAEVNLQGTIGDFEVAKGEVDELKRKLEEAQAGGADKSVITGLEAQLGAAEAKAAGLAETIATSVPTAVNSWKTVVDEAGNVRKEYDLNIAAAKELTQANIDAYGGDIQAQQNNVIAGLEAQSSQVSTNIARMRELEKEMEKGQKAGENVDEQRAEWQKLSVQIQETTKSQIDNFNKANEAGLVTEDGIKRIAKALGRSESEIRQMVEAQKKLTEETNKTEQAQQDLAKAYAESKSKLDDDIKANVARLQAWRAAGKTGTDEYKKMAAETRALVIQRKNLAKSDEAVEKMLGLIVEKGKTALQIAKETYAAESERLETAAKVAELSRNSAIISQQRSRTQRDDLINAQSELDVAKNKLEVLKTQLKVSDSGVIGIRFATKDEKRDAVKLLSDAQNAVQEKQNQVGDLLISIGIDERQLQEELRSLDIENLKLEVELGLRPDAEVRAALQSRLVAVRNAQKTIAADDKKGKAELRAQELALQKEILDIDKAAYDDQQKLIDARIERERGMRDRILESEQRLVQRLRKVQDKAYNKAIDEAEQNRLDALDKVRERDIISEEDYEKRKTEIQAEAARAREVLAKRAEGQQRFDQDQALLIKLQDEKKDLEKALADPFLDQGSPEAAIMRQRLEDLNSEIAAKSNILVGTFDELGQGIGEGLAGAMAGDPEAMKDALRGSLAVIAGFIERAAQGFVIGLLTSSGVMSTISALPFPLNIAALPAIKLAIGGAVSALLNPVLSSLTSFASGGRVDSPTMAVIGDAATANRNTEWVMRDSDIQEIVALTVAQMESGADRRHREQMAMLARIEERQVYLRGEDMVLATGRAKARSRRRIRT